MFEIGQIIYFELNGKRIRAEIGMIDNSDLYVFTDYGQDIVDINDVIDYEDLETTSDINEWHDELNKEYINDCIRGL